MKRFFSTLIVGLLGAHVLLALPIAHAATTVPATVQVKDPVDDANFLNDQDNAYGNPAQGQGDHATPKDAGSATDFMAIWYTNDADTVSLHIQTQAPPSNLAEDVYFRIASNPGTGAKGSDPTRGCIFWTAFFNGTAGAYTDPDSAAVTDSCNVGAAAPVTTTVETLDDTTGVITLTAPRSYSPLFADGSILTKTFGVARVLVVGPTPQTVTAATSDTTQRGTDFAIAGGTPTSPPPVKKPPVKKPPVKHKKHKKPKPPVAAGCAAYQPGDLGKDAKTTVVTDAATADAPVKQDVATPAGAGTNPGTGTPADGTAISKQSHTYLNLQVDSAAASTGLYVKIQTPAHRDYDLYLYNPDGSQAARSAGYAPVQDDNGQGGHSTADAEEVDGLKTNDCQGYTIDIVGATTDGGSVTLTTWLGDVKYDPSAASSGAAKPI